MPYKSKAQAGKFQEGKISKKTVDEPKGKKLPERSGKKVDPTQPRDMSSLNDNYDIKRRKK